MDGAPPQRAWLVVGLGNPGARYERTRHNIGAAAVERLADLLKLRFARPPRERALIAERGGLVLARPTSYMNECGPVVARLSRSRGAVVPLVVSDDLDLPLGALRFRTKGSPGGHKGLASIAEALGTQDFPRLKLGISRPDGAEEVSDYVLGGFAEEERELYERTVDRAAEALRTAVTRGLRAAMNAFSS